MEPFLNVPDHIFTSLNNKTFSVASDNPHMNKRKNSEPLCEQMRSTGVTFLFNSYLGQL